MKKPTHKSSKKSPQKKDSKPQEILWTVHGPRWNFICKDKETACPIELATNALEKIWTEDGEDLGDMWKTPKKPLSTTDSGEIFIEEGEEPTLGILLEVSNQTMDHPSQHIMIPTALVLANAGLHNESTRLEKFWQNLNHRQQLEELINILNKDQENDPQ